MILGNRLTRFFAGYFLKQLHIKNNFLVRLIAFSIIQKL